MNKPASREQLIRELIDVVTDAVNLRQIDKSTLNAETTLVRLPGEDAGTSLSLDSVDLLEAAVVIEHRFSVKIENAEAGRQIMQNFGTIADFIISQQL